jgi:excisionase family DNA binding protein
MTVTVPILALSFADAGRLLGVSTGQAHAMVRNGELRGGVVGRRLKVSADSLSKYVARQTLAIPAAA